MIRTLAFTARVIEELMPLHKRNMTVYWDSKEDGLGLYITPAGYKTYFIRKQVNGRDRRIALGSATDMSPDQARSEVRNMKQQLLSGIDPYEQKVRARRGEMKLGTLYKQYMDRYSKIHKRSWKHDEVEIKMFLGHWFNLRLSDIKRADIRLLHEEIYREKGPYRANRMLERIKAMYNKAIEWDWEGINPAMGIRMYPVKSRDRFIRHDEMPFFIKALEDEKNRTVHDFVWMLLFTGARKTNTAMMRWEEINWKECYWRIPESKNGDPLVIPLVERAMEILETRRRKAIGPWVFPGEVDPDKHFSYFRRAWTRILKRATIYIWSQDPRIAEIAQTLKGNIDNDAYINMLYNGVQKQAEKKGISLTGGVMDVRVHDLRRTMGSYQAINGTSLHVIGQSLGHRSIKSTQIYARLTIDPVRDSMTKAMDRMVALGQ